VREGTVGEGEENG